MFFGSQNPGMLYRIFQIGKIKVSFKKVFKNSGFCSTKEVPLLGQSLNRTMWVCKDSPSFLGFSSPFYQCCQGCECFLQSGGQRSVGMSYMESWKR